MRPSSDILNAVMLPRLIVQAFQTSDVQKIEFLLAAGARLRHVGGAGDGRTREFCDDHRRASRLRLVLAAAGRPGADPACIPLTAQLLQQGAARQPLCASSSEDADDVTDDYLPEDAIELAHRVGRVGHPPQVVVARMIMRAAAPWSPATHHLWPAAARAYVFFLLLAGSRWLPAARDVWVECVVPRVVRRSGPMSQGELDDEDAYHGMLACYRMHYPWRYHDT